MLVSGITIFVSKAFKVDASRLPRQPWRERLQQATHCMLQQPRTRSDVLLRCFSLEVCPGNNGRNAHILAMNNSSIDRPGIGWIWWSTSIAAALGAAWLLLQMLAVFLANNPPQAAILLGVSIVVVGIPTFLVAIFTLVYAARRKPLSGLKHWRAGVALSAVNAAIPVVAGGLLLAVKFGLV